VSSSHTTFDYSGNQNNATMYGDANTNGSGAVGKGLSLDGTGDYVSIPHNSSLNPSGNEITISVWVKWNGSGTTISRRWGWIVMKGNDQYAANGYGILQDYDSDAIYFRASGSENYAGYARTNFVINRWYHLVGVRTNTTAYLYVDGVLKSSRAVTPSAFVSSNPLHFGQASYQMHTQYFNGYMDEVAIWNRALTSQEVTNLYNTGI
jgi:hypothetical protein